MIIVLPEALDSYDEALLNFQRYLEPEKIANAGVKDWVSICPKVTSQGVNGAVIGQLIDLYKDSLLGNKTPAYEGRNDLYTAGHLPIESKEFVIKLVDRDVHTKSTSYVLVGRSFSSTTYRRTDSLGDGLECWRGFYQSIRPTHMGLSLNIGMLCEEGRSMRAAVVVLSQLLGKEERFELFASASFEEKGGETKGISDKRVFRFESNLRLPLKGVIALKHFRW
ncbi:hypothetical protein MRB53_032702 [Persea americana]|uniref:Uncharacterized protein n=1 Tax=Persea americana TaxID=3435 RepID=A0ACC2KSY6_PERAE|nr:hypothetical protein MRB53_032702 [Persea americana]